MAEEQDDAQKTEQPSQRRLDEAREKGQLVVSREVGTFFLLAGSTLLCAAALPESARRLTIAGRVFLEQAHALPTDGAGLGRLLAGLMGEAAWAMLLPFLAFIALPILSAVAQNAVVWTGTPLQPKLERISPLAGMKRLFSARSLVELLKSLLKTALVLAALASLLRPEFPHLVASIQLEAGPFLAYLTQLGIKLLAVLALVACLIAGADYAHQRFDFMRQMRMSRQELLDEMKQSDGDPHIKQRLRALRLERARRRMMADVPKSTVVITNPTHFAVALRYAEGETPAPKVMAKGADAVALKIREIAKAHNIPVIENPPLARALHAACETGDLIPPAHYQAVAEIIGYVLHLAEQR